MINAIIFSKDRACQLHLLLESMLINSYKLLDGITVIYRVSNEEFHHGYELLKKFIAIPRIDINWICENNLKDDVVKTMQSYCRGQSSFITFLTDDSVFFRHIQQYKFAIESCMHPGSDIGCFTLRMGVNTKEATYWASGNAIDLTYTKVGNVIKWKHINYPQHHGYGYPMSVDGHIFRSAQITDCVQQLGDFRTVNNMEAQLTRFKNEIAPCMASFEQSALVTVPINRVQHEYTNKAGIHYGINVEELNRKYLAGEVIDYYSIDFSNIQTTHKELKYSFRSVK